MNNVCVSIIESVLIRRMRATPAGWETRGGCTSNQESGGSPSVVVNLRSSPPLASPSMAGTAERWAKSSGLSFKPMNPPPACRPAAAVKAADLRPVANQGMALLLMKRHRSIE